MTALVKDEVIAADPYGDLEDDGYGDAAAWYAAQNQEAGEDEDVTALEEEKVEKKEEPPPGKPRATGEQLVAKKELPDEAARIKQFGVAAAASAMARAMAAPGATNDEDAKDEKKEEEMADEDEDDDNVWDPQILVVRNGQIYIELQHRNPPMHDEQLKKFCDWLDKQLPIVVQNFPYVKRSGANIDLSDNVIGPQGLDKLFVTLRSHRVPVVVMKAYRNVLDDTIVDSFIEYLYTQPEAFPMHGLHISHNNITDKGALRLVRAASLCGHYPRYTTRLPLWLRLECNSIEQPHKVVSDSNDQGFNVCLMGDGLCSRPNCNHYSNVHVQLPYFSHQGQQGWVDPLMPMHTPKAPSSSADRYSPYGGKGKGDMPPQAKWGRAAGDGGGSSAGYDGGKGWKGDSKSWQANDGKGKGKDSAKGWGKNQRRGPLWEGKLLHQKVKVDLKLDEGETQLGFELAYHAEGKPPSVQFLDPSSKVGNSGIRTGVSLLRLNGLDIGMFNEKQIRDLLKQRPLDLRFGDK